jgi:hypothetical protein
MYNMMVYYICICICMCVRVRRFLLFKWWGERKVKYVFPLQFGNHHHLRT